MLLKIKNIVYKVDLMDLSKTPNLVEKEKVEFMGITKGPKGATYLVTQKTGQALYLTRANGFRTSAYRENEYEIIEKGA